MLYLVVFKLCWTSYLSHSSKNTISLEYTIMAPPFSKTPCGRHWNSLPQFGQSSLEDVPSPYFLFNSVTTQLNWLKCLTLKIVPNCRLSSSLQSFLIDSCSSSNDNFSALNLPSELFKAPRRWSPWKVPCPVRKPSQMYTWNFEGEKQSCLWWIVSHVY